MRIIDFEQLTEEHILDGVWQLLCKYDHSFIPPLSARENTFQAELTGALINKTEPRQYFEILKQQAFLVALDHNEVVGFMSYRPHYQCEDLNDHIHTIYVTTIIVDEAQRGKGITSSFYKEILALAASQAMPVTTRTWSTNASHIHILEKFGFHEVKRIQNGRGPNIDTVYYRKVTE